MAVLLLRVVKYSFLRYLAYPWEIFFYLLKQILQIFFLLFFWSLVLGPNGNIRDLSAYFFIAVGVKDLVMFDLRDYGRFLRKSIKFGNFNNYLIKPIQVIPYTFATVLGQNLLNYIVAILYIIIGIFMRPPSNILGFLYFGLFLIVAICISFAINLFEGALTFVFVEATGIVNSIYHVARILSGAVIPLYYFPENIRYLAELTPFPAIVYGPANSLRLENIVGHDLVILLSGIFWAVVLNIGVIIFWYKNLKSYEAVGI